MIGGETVKKAVDFRDFTRYGNVDVAFQLKGKMGVRERRATYTIVEVLNILEICPD